MAVEVDDPRRVVAASAVEPLLDAVTRELRALQLAVQRAEADAFHTARFAETPGLQVARYLEQEADAADARRRAELARSRLAAEQRFDAARAEGMATQPGLGGGQETVAAGTSRGGAAEPAPFVDVEVIDLDAGADEAEAAVDERFRRFWEGADRGDEWPASGWSSPAAGGRPRDRTALVKTRLSAWHR